MKKNVLDWLQKLSPGTLKEEENCMILEHDDGDFSVFYKRKNVANLEKIPKKIRFFYDKFEAIDFFSNTFQVAALTENIFENDEIFLPSLANLADMIIGVNFPEEVIPFMLEYGDMEGNQWIYAAAKHSDKIYSYDTRDKVFDIYDDVDEIISSWLDDVYEQVKRDDFGADER